MLNLERESEVDRGCLCRLGYPGRYVPGAGLEPALDHVFSFGFSFSFAPEGAPLRSHRGDCAGYPKR